MRFPHSVGLLYSALTAYCGFRVNSGEYKLMGLAPYGEPTYADQILAELIDLKADGSFRMDQSYFHYCRGMAMTSEKFERLFGGPPRQAGEELTQRHMDLAASIQFVVEEILLRMGNALHKQTGQSNLCLAGGVALNCVANGRLLREGPFKDIWIQPAAGDAGGTLGAALFVWHQLLGNPRETQATDGQQGSLLGPAFSEREVRLGLDELGGEYLASESSDELSQRVAGLLSEGKIAGWMQGRMEYGPRALGARSILADPRGADTQQAINLKIKFRESFRPFAPAVLVEDAAQFFELAPARESPYMLLVAPVSSSVRREEYQSEDVQGLGKLHVERSTIPAVTHVDYSARVQTVDSARSPKFHQLLRQFKEQTGLPLLVNTSFNVRDEPIVCSPADAYRCFMQTDLDVLVIENFLLLKEEQPGNTRHGRIARAATHDEIGEPAVAGVAIVGGTSRTGLTVFGCVLSALFALLTWKLLLAPPSASGAVIAAVIAAVITAAGALLSWKWPNALSLPYTVWMGITYPLRLAGSYVALGIFYFLILTPVGLTFRFLGRDVLKKQFDPDRDSYWEPIRDEPEAASYFRQF